MPGLCSMSFHLAFDSIDLHSQTQCMGKTISFGAQGEVNMGFIDRKHSIYTVYGKLENLVRKTSPAGSITDIRGKAER